MTGRNRWNINYKITAIKSKRYGCKLEIPVLNEISWKPMSFHKAYPSNGRLPDSFNYLWHPSCGNFRGLYKSRFLYDQGNAPARNHNFHGPQMKWKGWTLILMRQKNQKKWMGKVQDDNLTHTFMLTELAVHHPNSKPTFTESKLQHVEISWRWDFSKLNKDWLKTCIKSAQVPLHGLKNKTAMYLNPLLWMAVMQTRNCTQKTELYKIIYTVTDFHSYDIW